jgi:hypothetical protein
MAPLPGRGDQKLSFLGDDIDPFLMIDKEWTYLVVIIYLATP